jgi:hypothetical protein
MNDSESQGFRKVSELKKGDQLCFSPERFTELLKIRIHAGKILLTCSNPITGLPLETDYDPDDLVMVKNRRSY